MIYEEIAYELDLKFDNLDPKGFVNALIAMKLAPTKKVKSITNELEALMVEHIDTLGLGNLAQIVIAYNQIKRSEMKAMPIQGQLERHATQVLMDKFHELIAETERQPLSIETTIHLFV